MKSWLVVTLNFWNTKKLFEPLSYKVEFIYIFNDWFKQDQYKDVLEYIREMGCWYFFNSLPLTVIGVK